MEKFTVICSKYGFNGYGEDYTTLLFNTITSSSEVFTKYIDGELYVDKNQLWKMLDVDKPINPIFQNVKMIDFKYFDNCGFNDGSEESLNLLLGLNQLIGKFGDNYEINPLMKFSSSITFHIDDETVITTFFGVSGKFNEYVSILIDTINGIDLSSIDITDVLNYELSDEKKIFSSQKINVTDLKPNERCFSINEEDFINYLLHILPQYLPSDVKLHPSIVGIINDDEDDVSIEFRDILWEKSHQYLMGMKTKINSVDFSKIDLTKVRVS
ncbi:hypothetical protein CPG37_10910 [Malaciobacter canalis]|uniref:Uncharacterized protein n=1 Tax=Malaciobacter canalis TaxID=1912871 RepID=A0ABX4LNF8_9BACT|nr:hypothetical protein [Malaciobacter canalis]PHO09100.1 hypothetical protein CPG37_10910 [Malaciobacter canalis]QEE31796.1 hypothetical protein ACAN_0285 [Malaciobacter canalis]